MCQPIAEQDGDYRHAHIECADTILKLPRQSVNLILNLNLSENTLQQ